jgi:hypothetical protein
VGLLENSEQNGVFKKENDNTIEKEYDKAELNANSPAGSACDKRNSRIRCVFVPYLCIRLENNELWLMRMRNRAIESRRVVETVILSLSCAKCFVTLLDCSSTLLLCHRSDIGSLQMRYLPRVRKEQKSMGTNSTNTQNRIQSLPSSIIPCQSRHSKRSHTTSILRLIHQLNKVFQTKRH